MEDVVKPIVIRRERDADYEYDPLTGISTKLDYSDPGKVKVTRAQDIEPNLEYAKVRRDKRDPVDKDGWNHYATIPPLGELEMRRHGINLYRDDAKVICKWINEHHPEWKTTHFWHHSPRARARDPRSVIK